MAGLERIALPVETPGTSNPTDNCSNWA
jgi:hypothetical protein